MSHSFVRLYLIKCVVCVLNYMFDQTKKIFDNFICIWKWFLSPFMFMFSAYFVFHCFKHVLCWKKKKGVRVFSRLTRESRNWKNAFSSHFLVLWQRGSRLTNEWALKPSKRLQKFHENCFRDSSHNSPSHETPRNSLLKCFSWETCFKPLPSSLKPLFQYFYIKTQPIWMVFHSINISKVIINSFH